MDTINNKRIYAIQYLKDLTSINSKSLIRFARSWFKTILDLACSKFMIFLIYNKNIDFSKIIIASDKEINNY